MLLNTLFFLQCPADILEGPGYLCLHQLYRKCHKHFPSLCAARSRVFLVVPDDEVVSDTDRTVTVKFHDRKTPDLICRVLQMKDLNDFFTTCMSDMDNPKRFECHVLIENVDDVRKTVSRVKEIGSPYGNVLHWPPFIASTATVMIGKVPEGCFVGPYAYIEAGAVLGQFCWIDAYAHVRAGMDCEDFSYRSS